MSVPAPGAAGNPAEALHTQEEEEEKKEEEEEEEESLAFNGHIRITAASESRFAAG